MATLSSSRPLFSSATMVFLNVGLAVAPAISRDLRLVLLQCRGKRRLEVRRVDLLEWRQPERGAPARQQRIARLGARGAADRALARRAAELPLDVLFDLALAALLFTSTAPCRRGWAGDHAGARLCEGRHRHATVQYDVAHARRGDKKMGRRGTGPDNDGGVTLWESCCLKTRSSKLPGGLGG